MIPDDLPRTYCGQVSKENRKSQSHFECVACGYTANADDVASINIDRRTYGHCREEIAILEEALKDLQY